MKWNEVCEDKSIKTESKLGVRTGRKEKIEDAKIKRWRRLTVIIGTTENWFFRVFVLLQIRQGFMFHPERDGESVTQVVVHSILRHNHSSSGAVKLVNLVTFSSLVRSKLFCPLTPDSGWWKKIHTFSTCSYCVYMRKIRKVTSSGRTDLWVVDAEDTHIDRHLQTLHLKARGGCMLLS